MKLKHSKSSNGADILLIIVSAIIIVIALIYLIHSIQVKEVNETKQETVKNVPEWAKDVAANADTFDEEMLSKDGYINGTNVKTVKEYKTLADAQNDMGYGFGLKNTIKAYPYELARMFNINDEWYQGEYLDETEYFQKLTVKVSDTTDVEQLIMPYNVVDYSYTESMNVEDVEVVLYGTDKDYIAVACFTVNNKNYSIYTPLITGDIMRGIVTECIENNM